ncbi:flippase [Urechidicola croceus]|uniref:Uncharacterized protein n=1 Tax=Urechidicola croceus TaxID=1850246 RepID=A0A1D8P9E5_9FLAO|nr:flippase [Urechidicola croceus]AOW21165.1 hypothetical protein LPB138_10960 [Urechidicola croceus]
MIKKNFLNDKSLKEIVSKSATYFFLRIFAFVFAYLFAILTTRNFGESTFGYVTLAFSILMISSVICRLGFDINLTRIVAQDKENKQIGLYTKSIIISFLLSLLLSIIIYFNANYISINIFNKEGFIPYLKWISFAIPLWSMILINSFVFRGYKKTFLYSIFNSFGRFLLTTILLITFIYLYGDKYVYAPIVAHFFGLVILCIGSFIFIKKTIKDVSLKNEMPFKLFFNSSFPMFLSTSLIILLTWVDKVYLGYYVEEEKIGIYDISLRIAALIGFTLEALNSILTPKISEAYINKDYKTMQKEITFSAKINFFLSIGVFLFIIIFSKYILQVFSEKFIQGQIVLFICCIGQLVNAFSGPVGNILQMTGQQKIFTKIIAIAFLINLILNPILIQIYDIEGAAISMVISMVFWNFTSSYFVYKKLGIKSYYLPFIK